MSEENKGVALITGTSSGIGYAAAIALQNAGFKVFAGAPETNSETDELKRLGIEVLEFDITNEESCRAAVKAAEAENGAVSVLVNNAGYGQYGPIEEIPLDAIRHNFEVNVFGLIKLSQLVLPGMRNAGKGRIVNVSSVAGEIKQPGSGIYHATKHAVEAVDGALRAEVDGFGIQIVGVLPGPVGTNFAETAVAQIPETGPDSPYFVFKQNLAKVTRQMLDPGKTATLTPEDVAEVIVKAATVENPSVNYHVGTMSKVMAAVSGLLPDKVWDAAMQQQIPMDKKI
ncbi:MAG: SDR family NAD(P)-dependent oxidoreductase [Pyrinomonadaceae bacterium]|nr:SDR family NAD(P)-dependent oxidoreductase [Pyrinomonadaceae bacterium]